MIDIRPSARQLHAGHATPCCCCCWSLRLAAAMTIDRSIHCLPTGLVDPREARPRRRETIGVRASQQSTQIIGTRRRPQSRRAKLIEAHTRIEQMLLLCAITIHQMTTVILVELVLGRKWRRIIISGGSRTSDLLVRSHDLVGVSFVCAPKQGSGASH